ncbi:MAG TPA: beta-propeller fold lactonase family protein [Candidatus Binatia bacterium]|jgi:DNA-binding beta-propeller fold protein YncE|nr:beta-propeller fold lactonase family protein [Candidatus Binatia bacterium]
MRALRQLFTGLAFLFSVTEGAALDIGTVNPLKGLGGLDDPNGIAVSPDGLDVYAVSFYADTIAGFRRNPTTGALRYNTQVYDGEDIPGDDYPVLFGALAVTVSPDGANVYTAGGDSPGGLGVFGRNTATGVLTALQAQGDGGNMTDVAVSPDGDYVYATYDFNSFGVWSRDGGTGLLTEVTTYFGEEGGIPDLDSVFAVTISPDGAHLYLGTGNGIVAFDRDAGTGEVAFASSIGSPTNFNSVTVSPDGANVYATTGAGVRVYARNATTGSLTFVEAQTTGSTGGGEVVVSPNGAQVYVAGYGEDAVAAWSRNPTTGALTLLEVERDGENGIESLAGAISLAVTPDGGQLFVGAVFEDAMTAFDRAAGGTLSFSSVRCAIDAENEAGLAVSPDGSHLYVVGDSFSGEAQGGYVVVLQRDPADGSTTIVDWEMNHCGGVDLGIDGASGVGVSPDGRHVYVSASAESAVAAFARDEATGSLAFVQALRDDEGPVQGIDGASGVAISSDGISVYVTGGTDSAMGAFARNVTTGTLSFAQVVRNGVGGVAGLTSPRSVAVSADGASVWAGGGSSLAVFRRATTGLLTFVEQKVDGVGGVDGIAGVSSVAAAPDAADVYVAGQTDNAVAVFRRNASTGGLTFVERERNSLGGVTGLSSPNAVAVSPDGARVYAAAQGGLVSFDRDIATATLTFHEQTYDPDDLLYQFEGIAVSSDSANVYVGGAQDLTFLGSEAVIGIRCEECVPAPLSGCRVPVSSGKAKLKLTDNSNDKKDLLGWTWANGQATDAADFGDPTTTTAYSLWLFDESGPGGDPALRMHAVAPAAAICGTKACWKPLGAGGYRFKGNAAHTNDGLSSFLLKPGTAGKARIKVSGRDRNLPIPGLPLTGTVTLQLRSSEGECWEALYSAPQQNTASSYSAKSD